MPDTLPHEVERKYRLEEVELATLAPYLSETPLEHIEQYYLNQLHEPYELRLRQTKSGPTTQACATLKKGSPPNRIEVETPVELATFELWAQAATTDRVIKQRQILAQAGGHWAVDTFLSHELYLLEAEGFGVTLPELGRDVTTDPAYTNYHLARAHTSSSEASTYAEVTQPTPAELQEHIAQLVKDAHRPVVIGICGATASGKTTLARQLAEPWGNAAELISQDDYYYGVTEMRRCYGSDYQVNFDAPVALNLALLTRHLADLQAQKPIGRPTYSMATSNPTGEVKRIDPSQKRVIIVEGIHTLHSPITDWLDFSIFLDTPLATRVGRRLERDLQEGRSLAPEANLRYLLEVAEPTFAHYAEQQKQAADVIL